MSRVEGQVKAGRDPKVSLNLRNVPFSIRQKFKILCATQGVDMQKVLVDFMEDSALADSLDYKFNKKKASA